MHLSGKKKEMLYTLGQFFKETDKKFSEAPLKVGIIKAEFIDIITSLSATNKKERAIYKNLESLQKEKFIVYDDRMLLLTRKGLKEYQDMITEMKNLQEITKKLEAQKIRFKRKIQAKLI